MNIGILFIFGKRFGNCCIYGIGCIYSVVFVVIMGKLFVVLINGFFFIIKGFNRFGIGIVR